MNLVLTVYGISAFKEYLLPSMDNTNYSIVIEGALFEIGDDISLNLEVVDRKWSIEKSEHYTIESKCEESEIYKLKNGDRKTIVFSSNYQLELIVSEVSNDALLTEKYDISKLNQISIGRDRSNDISYDGMKLVGKFHADIYRRGNEFVLRDKSKNGTFINGRRIKEYGKTNDAECVLIFGDCIDIYGLRLIYMKDFLAIRNKNGAVISDNLVKADVKEYVAEINAKSENHKLFHRSPRFIPEIDTKPIEIEGPPDERRTEKRPLYMVIGQPLTMMIPMVLGTTLMSFARGGNSAFMYTGIITSVGSAVVGTVWALTNMNHAKKMDKEYNEKRIRKYGDYLNKAREEVVDKYNKNTKALDEIYSCFAPLDIEASGKLWNRNNRHTDFLSHRVGIGEVDFQAEIVVPKEKFSLDYDELEEKARGIRHEYSKLRDVPICVDLLNNKLIGVIGGEGKTGCYQIMNNLVAQIVSANSYFDVKTVFLYDDSKEIDKDKWEFAKWLPHSWSDDRSTRFIAGNKNTAGEVCYEIARVLRGRIENNDVEEENISLKPHYIIFIENSKLLEDEIIAKYIYDPLLKCGITSVLMVENYDDLPNECEYIIENTQNYSGIYDVQKIDKRVDVKFDMVYDYDLLEFARQLSKVRLEEAGVNGEVPSMLTFFEMYNVKKPEELKAIDRWKKGRTYESMRALIGQKSGCQDMYLDINEKYHGPHGLLAGTTGAGKSETLQTYMLSLSLNFSPDDIGFFVIDYKGGGMANLFDKLPHMINQISNLSGNQVRRALVSIKSENVRRQKIFNEYGVNNIDKYTKLYKNGEAKVPVPHLIIVIDEFAQLKKEQPDFMQEIVSVSQVGRSLGVHLILATQRPGGVVSEDIRSNTKFKVCLRVQSKSDSSEVLGRSDAAYITQSGRGYLQVGSDEVFDLFQTAWSGAEYDDMETDDNLEIAKMLSESGKPIIVGSVKKRKRAEAQAERWIGSLVNIVDRSLENLGLKLEEVNIDVQNSTVLMDSIFDLITAENIIYERNTYNEKKMLSLIDLYKNVVSMRDGSTNIARDLIAVASLTGVKLPDMAKHSQLEAVVDYLANTAAENGYNRDFSLWMPLLPEMLELDDLPGYKESVFDGVSYKDKNGLGVMVGLVDDIENQGQYPLVVDVEKSGNTLLYGGVSTGKTTFMCTYIYSLISTVSPEDVRLYIASYSNDSLAWFADAPHIDKLIKRDSDTNLKESLLVDIVREMEMRDEMFEGENFEQYNKHNPEDKLPSIIVLIDNANDFIKDVPNSKTNILKILQRGMNLGVYVVVSVVKNDFEGFNSAMSEYFRNVISLVQNDKFDYVCSMRIKNPDILPDENVKGRGLCKLGDRTMEFQTAVPYGNIDDISEKIKLRCRELNGSVESDELKERGIKKRRITGELPKTLAEFADISNVAKSMEKGDFIPVGYTDDIAHEIAGINLRRVYKYVFMGSNLDEADNGFNVAVSMAAKLGDVFIFDFEKKSDRLAVNIGAKLVDNPSDAVDEMISSYMKLVVPYRDKILKFIADNNIDTENPKDADLLYDYIFEKNKIKKVFWCIRNLKDFVKGINSICEAEDKKIIEVKKQKRLEYNEKRALNPDMEEVTDAMLNDMIEKVISRDAINKANWVKSLTKIASIYCARNLFWIVENTETDLVDLGQRARNLFEAIRSDRTLMKDDGTTILTLKDVIGMQFGGKVVDYGKYSMNGLPINEISGELRSGVGFTTKTDFSKSAGIVVVPKAEYID